MSTIKTCVTCTKNIHGRKDKVYCSKKCQNQHHKITKQETRIIQRKKYNKSIKRNYVVLRGLMNVRSSSVIVHRNNLKKYGFDFHHYLHKTKKGTNDLFIIKEFQFTAIGRGKYEVRRLRKGPIYTPEFVDRWSREFPLVGGDVLVSYEEGDKGHFEGDLYSYFERKNNYKSNCLVASATNLLRRQKEQQNLNH